MVKEKKIKIKREKSERMKKLDSLKNDTSLSSIRKELTQAVSELPEKTVRSMYYTFKMWTLNADPTKKLKETLEVAIRAAQNSKKRDESLDLPTDVYDDLIKGYKKKLSSL